MCSKSLRLCTGSVIFLLLLGQLSATSTTPAPTETPTPSAGAPMRLSFVIDGIAYAVECNISGLNCTFVTDHGLTVTPVTGTAEIPTLMQGVLWATLVIAVVLLIMAAVIMYFVNKRQTGQGYEPMPAQYPPPGYGPGAYAQADVRPKIIGVNLVQPCLGP